jgi:hypothetical protein
MKLCEELIEKLAKIDVIGEYTVNSVSDWIINAFSCEMNFVKEYLLSLFLCIICLEIEFFNNKNSSEITDFSSSFKKIKLLPLVVISLFIRLGTWQIFPVNNNKINNVFNLDFTFGVRTIKRISIRINKCAV